MTFSNCVDDAWTELDADKAERMRQWKDYAQGVWREAADQYERMGSPRHQAEAMAAEDAKLAFKRKAGEERHVLLSRLGNMRKQQIEVAGTTNLRTDAVRAMERMDYRARGLKRRFDGMVKDYLMQNHRTLLGNNTDPINQANVVREMHGEATGDAISAAYAQSVKHALEQMRLMANEAGATIGKLDNYHPHSHNRIAVMEAGLDRWARENGMTKARAKVAAMTSKQNRDDLFQKSFDAWFDEIAPRLDWSRIENFATGRPFQPEGSPPPLPETQRRFMREIFNNIAYGENWSDPKYGRAQGAAKYRQLARQRQLHFRSADDWMEYNKAFGTGDPHKSLMSHVHRMARDIVSMREFGPNPAMGLEYRGQLIREQAAKDGADPRAYDGNINHAVRMMRVEQGSGVPGGYGQALSASFFSNLRGVLTAAMLDRAIVASISDLNFSKVAAQTIGAQRSGPFQNYIRTVQNMVKEGSLTTQEMLQWQWVADTMADPGVQVARFNAEVPSSEVVERMTSGVMRLQGLSQHTDAGRFALQQVFSGQMGLHIGRSFDDIEPGLRSVLQEHGITAKDWNEFAREEWAFTAPNGAKFLNPLYWREATDLPAALADDLFYKFQGAAEDFIELGVPTQSLFMRGAIDPVAHGMTPGTIPFETLKSGLMFKSFIMAFSYNQFRAMRRMGPGWNRWAWMAESVAGATVLGGVALQLGELIKGNDPQGMDDPLFWGRAMAKGGGLGVLGDIVSTGEASWGGGFPEYVAGPLPQVAGDAWKLTMGNLIEIGTAVMTGEELDTNFPKEITDALRRYTPGGQTPIIGPAFDRMIADQLFMMLDPEGHDALLKKAQRRENLYGNGAFWLPGSPMPDRAPDLSQAFGSP